MIEHQDWETVFIRNKKKAENNDERKKQFGNIGPTMSAVTNKPAWKIEKQIEDGKTVSQVSKDDSQKILQGRLAMKLTQKELAQRLNMQFKDIQEIETGKAIENKAVLSKIKRYLHV